MRSIRVELSEIPILVRVSGTDWEPDGFGVDEIVELSHGLAEDGADLIDVSSGGILSNSRIPVGPGYQVPLASGIRAGALPVGAVGFITGATQSETILMTGQTDVILLGRPLLSDPHLPIRWARELRLPDWESLISQQYFRANTFF